MAIPLYPSTNNQVQSATQNQVSNQMEHCQAWWLCQQHYAQTGHATIHHCYQLEQASGPAPGSRKFPLSYCQNTHQRIQNPSPCLQEQFLSHQLPRLSQEDLLGLVIYCPVGQPHHTDCTIHLHPDCGLAPHV